MVVNMWIRFLSSFNGSMYAGVVDAVTPENVDDAQVVHSPP